jgi:Na+/H+ antiporter NhaD/arsenite permease-like protein
MDLGHRPIARFTGLAASLSSLVILSTFLFGIDLRQYPTHITILAIMGIFVAFILIGILYKLMGFQECEDYTNAEMSPVNKEMLEMLRDLHKNR